MKASRGFWIGLAAVWSVCAMVAAPARAQAPSGDVKVDGSSTVYPITAAAAELYGKEQPGVKVTVGVSGTGGGFKKFLEDKAELRTDIQDASRPISPNEAERALKLGVEFIELPIAYDGLAVVVHPGNDFVAQLTLDELKKMWEPNSPIRNWKDVRPGFPDLPLKLYGPGPDSGTFDYFTEVVVGKAKACRSDFSPSEDDNVLVKGVEGDQGALGYFGYSYYEANKGRLKLLAIGKEGAEPVHPDRDTIRTLKYPLARPLFLYVNKAALDRPAVRGFVEYYLGHAQKIVEHRRVNYIALSDALYEMSRKRLADGVTGTVYGGPETHAQTLYAAYGVQDK